MITEAQKRRLFQDLNQVDAEFAEKLSPILEVLYSKYFRCEVSGWDHVPDRKVLFVGNHNGLITFEVVMLFHAWWKRYKNSRRALGLAHGIALNHPFFRWLCPRIGAIPADPAIAREAFERGYSLLVYPGGEKEAFRPFTENRKVDFYQRKGFIRLALKSGVPIVPVVSVGAQESYIILHRGEKLAEKLGLKEKYRLHGVPITFRLIFFLWLMATGVFTFFPLLLAPAAFAWMFVPLPSKMVFRLLPAIDVQAWMDPEKTEEENLQSIYDRILTLMQDAVHEEYAKRKIPIIG